MNPRLMVCALLFGCSTTLALGQQNVEKPWRQEVPQLPQKTVEKPWPVYNEWLTKQSKDLLDIIRILYAGRDAELKELEAAQANMEPDKQIERRIALIKATLSEKEAKPSEMPSPLGSDSPTQRQN
jgi:hypothetical protein